MFLKEIYRKLRKWYFGSDTLISVYINKENILHNLNEYKNKYPKLSFIPVLKSNAYGHGLIETGRILDKTNSPFLGVDSHFEAALLRRNGVKSKILILGFSNSKTILKNKSMNISWAITTLESLKHLDKKITRPTKIHLKINTGMNRLGLEENEINESIMILKNNPKIILEGLYSHFADADGDNENYTLKQIEKWNTAVKKYKDNFSSLKYTHIGATSGVKFSEKIDANSVRLGKGVYGYYADNKDIVQLLPALSLETKIVSIKEIQEGEPVGYNMGYVANKKMKLATIPLGYFEGLDKRLSNIGLVKVQDKYCKIVGKVSMNMSMIDVSEVDYPKINDKVEVISPNTESPNSIKNIASLVNTNQAEILVHINPQLGRIVI